MKTIYCLKIMQVKKKKKKNQSRSIEWEPTHSIPTFVKINFDAVINEVRTCFVIVGRNHNKDNFFFFWVNNKDNFLYTRSRPSKSISKCNKASNDRGNRFWYKHVICESLNVILPREETKSMYIVFLFLNNLFPTHSDRLILVSII